MKSSCSRRRGTKAFGLLVAAGLVSGLLSVTASAQQPKAPAAAAPSSQPAPPAQVLSPAERQKREEWQRSMSQIPMPKKGCFNSSYPTLEWHEVPCGQPSKFPNPPARGPRPNIVGNGNDISAVVSGPTISSVIGSFDSVTPATVTESGAWGGNPNAANAFTLQINSQFFPTPACGGVAGCTGWQQFIYSQNQCSGPCVFIEYWLLNFGTCPSGPWIQSGNSCFFNSGNAPAPAVTAAQLQGTTLTGTAAGGTDTVVVTTAGGTATGTAADSVLNLEQQWNTAEFNVFGDCCLAEANFSSGTTILTRTRVINGSSVPPLCLPQGFTGETNNLSFGPSAPAASPPGPALVFTESSAGGSPSNCAAATNIGGTADLAILKTAPLSVVAGGLLTYSLNVSNNGPAEATDVVVTDTLPGGTTFLTSSIPCTAGGTCTIGNLANAASASFTITVRVSASLLSNLGVSATNITNTATVKSDQFDPNPSNNTATASTLVTESADLALTKTCKPDTPAQAGTSAFCDIQVANLGVSDAQNVVVTDAMVSNASFTVTSVTAAAASCTTSTSSPTSATATCNLHTVAAGGGTTIHVAFTSNDPGDINDTATVTSTTPDPVGGNNSATGRVNFFASADLAISKTAAPNPVVAGTNVRYTIAVSNGGPSSASNVVVKDTLPAEVRVLTVTPSVGSCTAGIPGNPLQPLTCTIGSVVTAGLATIAVTARVDPSVSNQTVINNNATVSSAASDPNNSNNSATAAVTVFTRCFCCKCRQFELDDGDETRNREDGER